MTASLIVLGVIVSAIVQFLKQEIKNEYYVLATVAVLSIAAAGVYCALVNAGLWQSAVQIMTIAGAIYTFIIARFEAQ